MCQSLVCIYWLNIKLKGRNLIKKQKQNNYKTQGYAVYKRHTSNRTQKLKAERWKRYTMQLQVIPV